MTKSARLKRVAKWMELFDEKLPRGFTAWAEKNVFKKHFFYNSKEKHGFCEICGNSFSLKEVHAKHNETVKCPECKNELLAKAAGRMKNGFTELYWVEKHEIRPENTILVRHIRHIRSYDAAGNKERTEIREYARTVYKPNKIYETFFYYPNDCVWDEFRKYMGYSYTTPSEYSVPRNAILYDSPKKLEKMIESKTDFKHTGIAAYLEGLMKEKPYYTCMATDLIDAEERYPIFEMLAKSGLPLICNEVINRWNWLNDYNKNAKGLREFLKVTQGELKLVRSMHKDLKSVGIVKRFRKFNLSLEQLEKLYRMEHLIDPNDLKLLMKYMSFDKALTMHDKYSYHYKDYIKMAEDMKYDMKSKSVIFPKDVNKAHDDIVKIYKAKKDEIRAAKMRKVCEELTASLCKALNIPTFNFSDENYMIVLPEKDSDLSAEGAALGHCVGSYIGRMADGETTIFFIRQLSNPEKPFFTMEIKDGKIIQIHGKRNCNPDSELRKFCENFRDKVYKAA